MPVFKLYDCKVRLSGSVLNEVPRVGVTAPEIDILRAIHGSDAVVNVKEVGQVERSDRKERERLNGIFANPAKTFGAALTKKKAVLTDLFGHDRNPLPKELEDSDETDDVEEADGVEEAAVEAKVEDTPVPRRTRVPAKDFAA